MRELSGLISVTVVIAIFAVASPAQQISQPTTPGKNVCVSDVGRTFLPSQEHAKAAQSGNAKITLVPPDSKRDISKCGLLTLAILRTGSPARSAYSSIASSTEDDVVRRPTGLLNFELLAAKPLNKLEVGNMLAAESPQDQGQPAAATEAQELAKIQIWPLRLFVWVPRVTL